MSYKCDECRGVFEGEPNAPVEISNEVFSCDQHWVEVVVAPQHRHGPHIYKTETVKQLAWCPNCLKRLLRQAAANW